jgi:hypothetical protein
VEQNRIKDYLRGGVYSKQHLGFIVVLNVVLIEKGLSEVKSQNKSVLLHFSKSGFSNAILYVSFRIRQ